MTIPVITLFTNSVIGSYTELVEDQRVEDRLASALQAGSAMDHFARAARRSALLPIAQVTSAIRLRVPVCDLCARMRVLGRARFRTAIYN